MYISQTPLVLMHYVVIPVLCFPCLVWTFVIFRGLFHKTRLENKPGLFWLVRFIVGEFRFINQT